MFMPPSAAPDSAAGRSAIQAFAGDVEYYLTLTPRQLPSRYLYDALGSALFEAICELPWYRITRAERYCSELQAAGRSSTHVRSRWFRTVVAPGRAAERS